MKNKLIPITLALSMSFCALASACDNSSASNSERPSPSDSESTVSSDKSLEEQLKEDDLKYSSALYLARGESYAYEQQLLYKETSTEGIRYDYDTENFSVSNGIIKAADSPAGGSNAESITSDVLTVSRGESTETVMIHTVDKEKYGDSLMTLDVGRLYGKNVMFFGDSITHNWAKYPNGDKSKIVDTDSLGYNHIPMMNEVCHFSTIVNAAWSGGTMAYLPSSKERFTWKSFPGNVDEHIGEAAKADYIFVMYGTNDLTEQVPVGEPTDTMATDETNDYSFYAGLNYGLDTLRKANPQAKIVLMTILSRASVYFGQYKYSQYNGAIAEAGERYKTKVVDMFPLIPSKELKTYLNADGLHPNDSGYRLITDFLLSGR